MWFIIGAIVVFVLFKFIKAAAEDNQDVSSNPIPERFSHLISKLNDTAFNGEGRVEKKAPNVYTLYRTDSNQIIIIQYMMKVLTVTWRYKYYQKELVYEEKFHEANNVSLFEQERMANKILETMKYKVSKHIDSVDQNVSADEMISIFQHSLGLNVNPSNFTFEEKVIVTSLLLLMANIDDDVDPSEIKAINNSRAILGINNVEMVEISQYVKDNEFTEQEAFEKSKYMSKDKRDMLLIMLKEVAAADGIVQDSEAELFVMCATEMGYSAEEVERTMVKYYKLMEMLNE